MHDLSLIGSMAKHVVKAALQLGKGEPGVVRFVMAGLSREEIAAIVRAIQTDSALSQRVDIALPRYGFADFEGIDPAYLTDRSATELRHAECDREARLIALLDDSQGQSLAQVDRLDATALLNVENVGDWVSLVIGDLVLPDKFHEQLVEALKALVQIDRVSMRQTANYLVHVASLLKEGERLTVALGRALPQIRLPRYDALFDDIPEKRRTWLSEWTKRFQRHWRRECYISKRDQNQIPLSSSRLRERLDRDATEIEPDVLAALVTYLGAPPGDAEAAFAPFRLDWSQVAFFFEEAQRNTGKSLGAETRSHFELFHKEDTTSEDQAYLDDLAENRGRVPERNDVDVDFFVRQVTNLREDARLYAMWDKFIYGREVTCTDLYDGLVRCLQRLRPKTQTTKSVLIVEGLQYRPGDFLPLNDSACTFFATRYRGIEDAFQGLIQFRRPAAFKYLEFAQEIAEKGRRTPDASSKRARQLEFRVSIGGEGEDSSGWIKLVWEANLDAVGIGLRSDLQTLLENRTKSALILAKAGQRRSRTRGGPASITLADLSTLEPAAQRNRGSFIPSQSQCKSLAREFRLAVDRIKTMGLLDDNSVTPILESFGLFEAAYRTAISDFLKTGASSDSLSEQAHAYSSVIDAIITASKRPVVLEELLKPLLQVGVAQIDGHDPNRPMVIVCAWHPLRLEAQHGRNKRLHAILTDLLAARQVSFTDSNGHLFFDELVNRMRDTGRPEVVVTWPRERPIVVTQIESQNDYSLHEPPVSTGSRDASTNDNARAVAKQIAALAQSYLKLQPHERDNLSIVLFNCDAAALPQAVVDNIRLDAEKEGGDAMCQVVLRHTDEEQLRSLYQQLVTRELEADSLHASEATRDFMSRLRISILVNQQAPGLQMDGPPYDIVFCHDVISRQADLAWVDIFRITKPADAIHTSQWSRRRPIGRGDRDAVMYLACPAQTEAGWKYMDALSSLFDAELAQGARLKGHCRIPARRTDVKSDMTHRVLQETHQLGNWVVNFDDLLDRRQLLNNEIKIIRYKHAADGERSLIISSRAPDDLLRATLRSKLKLLSLPYDNARLEEIARSLIDDANEVSGDIVLRAARRGTNASELIGVVLSKFLVEHQLGQDRAIVWVFLDDYANWLGQDERRIADLLCLAPFYAEDGTPSLDIIVTEAKYVSSNVNAKAEDSAKQLTDTLKRLESVLHSTDAPADKEIWLARLSEMLLDGLRDQQADELDWRSHLRDGKCNITLRGYSHVFTSAMSDAGSLVADTMTGVPGTLTGYQEKFGFHSVGEIVQAYADGRDPSEFRQIEFAVPAPLKNDSSIPVVETERTPASDAAALSEDMTDQVASIQLVSTGSRFQDLLLSWNEGASSQDEDQAWLEEISAKCRNALLRYGMSAKLESGVLTPNAALLKFRGADDLTVSKVEAKATELETTHGIELFDVRAEPGRVVLSIRRPKRRMLSISEVWGQWEKIGHGPNSKLLIAVKEDDGLPLYLEPDPAPHTLVAGSTGSGKSVLIQNIILGIGATNTPAQAKIVLIDPKAGVDYFAFDRLPHLDEPIIDQQERALSKLDELVGEMERRYALFKAARVSNVRSYNASALQPLPLIWLVHDEFADWMQIETYKSAVEAVVSRLGVKARAAGIYLIFAAQRPDNSVFPMQLRSNLGNRLILRVDSAGTSDLSLGVKGGGAERLLGKGHLAAILGGGTEPIFAQVPFISEERLEALVDAIIEDLENQP